MYGLALLLERGTLFAPPMAPALWRQLNLELCPEAEAAILRAQGEAVPARVRLLADVLGVLGLPLGIGQGNNPTCQSARALSMWAHNDPDYLLQMIVWAARDDDLVMHFEGQRLSSKELSVANAAPWTWTPSPPCWCRTWIASITPWARCARTGTMIRTAGSTRNSMAGGWGAASSWRWTCPAASCATTKGSCAISTPATTRCTTATSH